MRAEKALAVILAAGASRRMGKPKALLQLKGKSFLGACVAAFEGAAVESVVVLGADAEAIERLHPGLKTVRNPAWPDGQLSSARVGLRAALAQGAKIVFVHPVDAPRIVPSTVSMLLATMRTGARAAVPTHAGKLGHPLALGFAGIEAVLRADAANLWDAVQPLHPKQVPVKDGGAFENINDPVEYERLLGSKT
jgi:CTP:molybdopterin cytidylyltransferase MocA